MPQTFADQFRSIAMSPHLAASLERAHGFAREQGHRAVTLEHLLLAFTEDPDASAVLQASTIDLVRLGTDVSGYLGRLLEDMRAMDGADPQTDPELMRVLHAAVQAAQQSRRKQIDGAIVLAAVVGDGKSPAAGLLKAHGMTFEEAIRALQKANAKANAQARSKQFASPPPSAASPTPVEAPPAATSTRTASPEPAGGRGSDSVGQSVDDILAAARARIQHRTATTPGNKAPDPPPLSPPEPPPLSTLDSARPGAAPAQDPLVPKEPPQAVQEAPAAVPPPPPPLPPPAAAQAPAAAARPSRGPAAADRGPPAGRLPQPPQRSTPPFQQRSLEAGEGPPRPPLPTRPGGPGPGAPPLPGFPGRVARAPWPATDGPPALNGAHAEAPLAPPRRPGPGQRTGGQPGQGPLVETIPRRMRVGVPATAQVRIGRDRIDSLILLLMKGRGLAHRPEALASRSLSVRLKAPDGGFWIEPAAPETQWAEPLAGHQHDEQITWRWTVTPRHRGRGRLVLVVTARTVGRDGLATEAAAPDRVIEVAVSGSRLGRTGRWLGLVSALAAGALVGRFGGELWAIGAAVMRRLLG